MDEEKLEFGDMDIDVSVSPEGDMTVPIEKVKKAVAKFRIILMEYYNGQHLMSKSSLGIAITPEKATERVKEIVKEVLGEDATIENCETYQFASLGDDLLMFYIFNPYEETMIWENPDFDEEE
jgi:hypothetical protein